MSRFSVIWMILPWRQPLGSVRWLGCRRSKGMQGHCSGFFPGRARCHDVIGVYFERARQTRYCPPGFIEETDVRG
jgi:hypothetical protein